MTTKAPLDLVVVMPVYNEEGNIQNVVTDWLATLRSLHINFSLMALNDGSKDNSLRLLNALARQNSELNVVEKNNSGHGPTILQGYRTANAKWIFQVDSDNEISARYFPEFWKNRDSYDFIIGRRTGRSLSPTRRIVSLGARWTTRLLFGSSLSDVNCPYRLFRVSSFSRLFEVLPSGTFGPNVILSGFASKNNLRICELPVSFQSRTSGQSSILNWSLLKASIRSFFQTVHCFFTNR